MTKAIVGAVTLGIALGYFLVPEAGVAMCGTIITTGLCLILFLVGLDIGRQGATMWQDIKRIGFGIFLFPLAVTIGSLGFGAAAGLLLPATVQEATGVAAGMGWYSLAPIMLSEYSATLGAIAFLANVFREVFGILLTPIVAKYIGFVECIALPGAASMDTCLPVIVGATNDRIAIYSIASGVVLSISIPFLIELVMSF